MVRKYVQIIGDGVSTNFMVTHGLNTEDVIYQTIRNSEGARYFGNTGGRVLDANSIELHFTMPPKKGEYRVVLMG